MSQKKLCLVGGFLGSGKTTAIVESAQHLSRTKKKVGVITNDQGMQQVDGLFVKGHGIPSEEVSGGCFCCNYGDLEKGIHKLINNNNPDIIFAESVGSCTDLKATVINPLLTFNDKYEIILSVFADIRLLVRFLKNEKEIFYNSIKYIYEKQLEEADIIVATKIDLLNEAQLASATEIINAEYGDKIIHYQNSLSKENISEWLQLVNDNFYNTSLRSTLEIDYDIYGAGEAELAWLDEEIGIDAGGKNAVAAGYYLIHKIYTKIVQHEYSIGHLKFLINDGKKQWKTGFNSIAVHPEIEVPYHSESGRIIILINARVQAPPGVLQKIIAESVIETELSMSCKIIENNLSAFKPGYPNPTHRIILDHA